MSFSRIPFTVRDKSTKINAIAGMNFDAIKDDRVIKKVDANNAGNSNIINTHTATGSQTTFLSGDPDDVISIIGGVIDTETTGLDREMILSVTVDHTLKISNNDPIGVTGGFDCLDNDVNVTTGDINALVGTVTALNVTATGDLNGTLATAAQPNITSVGTLTSLTSSGDITTTTGTVSAQDVIATGVLTGTLATDDQPNITRAGTHIDLSHANKVIIDNDSQFWVINSHALNTQTTHFNYVGLPRVNYIRGTTEFSQDAYFSGSITGTLASGDQPNITNVGSRLDFSQASKVIVNNSSQFWILNTHALNSQYTHFNYVGLPRVNYIRGTTEFSQAVYFPGGTPSDDRLKHNEQIITNGLSVLSQLTPKKYDKSQVLMDANYNGDISGEYTVESGLIAQELLETDISFVVKIPDDLEIDPYGVDYNSVFTYAIAGIKELHAIVTTQAATISNQAETISTLEARLTALENK